MGLRLPERGFAVAATLVLERSGEFSVRYSKTNAHQCGPSLETDVLTYVVRLTMTDESLDENGFVIDNFEIAKFFHDSYHEVKVFQSCELIALGALKHWKSRLGDKLLAMEVTIAGMPQARITASERWVV